MRPLRWLIVLTFLSRVVTAEETPVSFNREIRGLLSNHCFSCHGPDEKSRKADLRLDLREAAIIDAIVPGMPDESPLVARLRTHDVDELMPPPEAKKPLTEPQITSLEHWIAQGAPYEPHWAFLPVEREAPPEVKDSEWTRHQLDPFILGPLESQRLSPSQEAPRSTLARRLHLDLTGILPSPETVAAFESDDHSNADERYLDRLLADPHYGERWGAALVRPSAVCRLRWLRSRRSSGHVALSRLGHWGSQCRQTLRQLHRRAAGRRSLTQTNTSTTRRHGIPSQHVDQHRGRL